jgi:hypothetical protein
MVEANALKLWRRVHLQWHDIPAEFHENLPFGLEFIRKGHSDGQKNW